MLELEHGFRVADAHAVLDPDESAVAARGRDISPEALQREFHQAGVARAVVSPGSREDEADYLRANNAVARLSVERPLVAFARIGGPRDPTGTSAARVRNLVASREERHTSPRDVEQYAYDDRFHGFVLDPVRDGLPDEAVFDRLDDAGAPLLVRVGPGFEPTDAAGTLLGHSFPVVFRSFEGRSAGRELAEEALALLDEHDQLYLDTALIGRRALLERGLLEHPDRILFGSGAPTAHPNVGVMAVLTLDVSEDLLRRAFEKNPARVIPALGPAEG